jgi:hypothetical protein
MQRFFMAIAGFSSILFFLGCAADPETIDASAEKSDNPAVEKSAPPHTASRQQVISQNPDFLISSEGMGKVKFGMTLGEVKEVLEDEVEYIIESPYIVDFDAIAVRQNGETLFYILHFADQPLQDSDRITILQTNNPAFQTAEGVHAGMLIQDAEKIYGEASIFTSEIETRELVTFKNQPEFILLGTFGGGITLSDSRTGIYQDDNAIPRETTEYRKDATIQHISISCQLDICWGN